MATWEPEPGVFVTERDDGVVDVTILIDDWWRARFEFHPGAPVDGPLAVELRNTAEPLRDGTATEVPEMDAQLLRAIPLGKALSVYADHTLRNAPPIYFSQRAIGAALEELARQYRLLQAGGDNKPTTRLASLHGLATSTVRNRLAQARAAGYLDE